MEDETFMNTAYVDADGKLKTGFVPASKMRLYNDNPERKWTPELEEYKKKRVVWLQEKILETDKKLKEDLLEWDRLRYSLFKDQLNIDLREDEQQLKYNGRIPNVINKRCLKKSEQNQWKYFDLLGRVKALELFNDVNVTLWGYVVVGNNQTTGGGKI
jgi:hypothetical protein